MSDSFARSGLIALPQGPRATPLMHDGVLFVHSFKDVVQALTRHPAISVAVHLSPAKDVQPSVKKSLAILDNLLFVPTSDAHMVALNIRTGAVYGTRGCGLTAIPSSAVPSLPNEM